MEFISVAIAGVAGFAFGAIWYMVLARKWIAASGVPQDSAGNPANRSDPIPYITSLLSAILVAGMMRHVFELSDIQTVGKGLISGFGIGLFLVSPWIATFYSFSGRPRSLLLIDGGYATLGCAVIGLVLTLF
ncbi:hypothetical protein ROLI_044200 [Roseobacter fucihabitans]|uniref:DUF1761 domain-containing protein n=1 Tax=Roseobacter fucihabitans TaxID=1537242 RepID=A0ABZ2BZ98_9RHOB|nr:DUF1761 domain-containing protein [Roseobacter litoralis]MBC6963899.1 hypothetical protein [Roseobacter litoralis]MBC6964016.1 hypothetical protein [Roseobacter litoralis]